MRVRPSSTPQALHLRSAPFLSFSSPSSHEQQPQQEQVVRKQVGLNGAHVLSGVEREGSLGEGQLCSQLNEKPGKHSTDCSFRTLCPLTCSAPARFRAHHREPCRVHGCGDR
eukprot:1155900-Pelagomonas_calceolata.AAC.1